MCARRGQQFGHLVDGNSHDGGGVFDGYEVIVRGTDPLDPSDDCPCCDAGVALVPQGGNTGLCGGSIPDQSGEQVLLSMGRMNKMGMGRMMKQMQGGNFPGLPQ